MGGSKKVKRVTWAADDNLCQVRMFLLDESPSDVAIGTQDHLQAKASGSVLHEGLASYMNLPPGFEGSPHENSWRVKLSQIPVVKWKFPIRFQVNIGWSVVAGEESTEVESQNQRESGVLEAVYPRLSAIPPNPSEPDTVEYSSNTEQFAPIIPLTPIEEEDASLEAKPGNVQSGNVETDVLTLAQAALTSIMAVNDQGSLIDRELLIKILSEPKMIEQLLVNHAQSSSSQTNSSTAQIMPPSSSFHGFPSTSNPQHIPSSSGMQMQNPNSHYVSAALRPPPMVPMTLSSTHMIRPETIPPSGQPFFPPSPVPNVRHPSSDMISVTSSSSSMSPAAPRDMSYYKSLIHQHGGERRDFSFQEQMNMRKSRDSKQKIMKQCVYFNTQKGCRNGANCPYVHDLSQLRVPEVPNTKRLKFDREITGL